MPLWPTLTSTPTKIIAHRGASGLRPEHTLVGHALAIAQGADIIEPDLVPSRDGVLFARHDAGLARSTDIARRPAFAHLATRNRHGQRDWPIHHFNADELDALRAIQPFPGRSPAFDSCHQLPRFDDLLDLAANASTSTQRIGLYPELKHPAHFAAHGIDVTARCIETLTTRQHRGKDDPVWLQCFEIDPLRRVHETLDLAVFHLIEPSEIGDVAWLRKLHAQHAWLDGIALPKQALIGTRGNADFTRSAHDLGWQVHVWTLRDDQVMPEFTDVRAELRALFALGVDALFADFPATAVIVRGDETLRCQLS